MKADVNGRPYAKLSELVVGDNVQVDEGFVCDEGHCLEPWSIHQVKVDEVRQDLYINCTQGRHYLEGQIDDPNSDHLIGVYHAPTETDQNGVAGSS